MPPQKTVTQGRWRAIALSLLVHSLIVAAAVLGWFTWKHEPPPTATIAIDAHVVDERDLKGIAAPPKPAPVPVPEPAPEPEPEPPPEEQGPPKPDPEEVERRQEEERQAAEKLEREQQEQLQRERDKQAQELKQRADAERLEVQKKEAEKQAAAEKKAADKKRADDAAAAKKAAEEKARQASEAELRRSLEAEERANAARSSVEANRWHASIVAKIERAWIKPPSAVAGMTCIVRVSQVPGGVVSDVTVDSCNPNEAALRQSVTNAVLQASPLPTPPPGVPFERNLELTFAPTS